MIVGQRATWLHTLYNMATFIVKLRSDVMSVLYEYPQTVCMDVYLPIWVRDVLFLIPPGLPQLLSLEVIVQKQPKPLQLL